MCVSRFKDRRRHSTQSCNATPHVVGRALCSTRCWYLYQVDQVGSSRILVLRAGAGGGGGGGYCW